MKKTVKMHQNDWCWRTVRAKDIEPGNLVSGIHATHPRHIIRVEKNEDGTFALWEDTIGHEMLYHTGCDGEHRFDLLVHFKTDLPVTQEELLHEIAE